MGYTDRECQVLKTDLMRENKWQLEFGLLEGRLGEA